MLKGLELQRTPMSLLGAVIVHTTQPITFWQHWKRGVIAMLYAYFTLFATVVPFWIGSGLLALLSPWPNVKGALGLVLFVSLCIVAPMLVSLMAIDRQAAREQLAATINAHVDRLASRTGLNWDDHYIADIEALLRKGDPDQAKKSYREQTGATWDESDKTVADWATMVVLKKLDLIEEHLGRTNCMPTD